LRDHNDNAGNVNAGWYSSGEATYLQKRDSIQIWRRSRRRKEAQGSGHRAQGTGKETEGLRDEETGFQAPEERTICSTRDLS